MTFIQFPKISPICRFVVWIVRYSPNSTTNPMGLRRAKQFIEKEIKKGNSPILLRAWSCVSSRNHDKWLNKYERI